MDIDVFACLPVTDLSRAVAWGDRLFGDVEAFEPNDTEHVWTLAGHRHVYVELLPRDAGHAKLTLFVSDFDGFLAAAAERGLTPADEEVYDNGVHKALFRDPDGNEVGIGGVPA
ncbi:VOC family protein [Pseudonocardia endophytica]|uniref:VOC domain-containing protein n=1 Tax=Pseudonocardia endophytica TaxID=401976 RepID=A0A4R1HPK8_PSEEN|nr:VOC family protein [Pseudonocardia endophytica]TCK24484.1 hypothetical protein EV378_0256 [Pseudonocardia endophytica]